MQYLRGSPNVLKQQRIRYETIMKHAAQRNV